MTEYRARPNIFDPQLNIASSFDSQGDKAPAEVDGDRRSERWVKPLSINFFSVSLLRRSDVPV
jgi:hypothetical protein